MANRYTYIVDDTNAVLIWDAENPTGTTDPNIYQPYTPTGKAWTKEEATEWANTTIENLLNPPVRPVDDESLDNNVIEVVPAE